MSEYTHNDEDYTAANEIANLRSEIERLRADRDRWQMKYDDTHKCLRALGNYND